MLQQYFLSILKPCSEFLRSGKHGIRYLIHFYKRSYNPDLYGQTDKYKDKHSLMQLQNNKGNIVGVDLSIMCN